MEVDRISQMLGCIAGAWDGGKIEQGSWQESAGNIPGVHGTRPHQNGTPLILPRHWWRTRAKASSAFQRPPSASERFLCPFWCLKLCKELDIFYAIMCQVVCTRLALVLLW